MADAKVTVRMGDREGDATARVLGPATDEDALARRLLLAKYQRPGKQDLVDWSRSSLPVAFDLGFSPTEPPRRRTLVKRRRRE